MSEEVQAQDAVVETPAEEVVEEATEETTEETPVEGAPTE